MYEHHDDRNDDDDDHHDDRNDDDDDHDDDDNDDEEVKEMVMKAVFKFPNWQFFLKIFLVQADCKLKPITVNLHH